MDYPSTENHEYDHRGDVVYEITKYVDRNFRDEEGVITSRRVPVFKRKRVIKKPGSSRRRHRTRFMNGDSNVSLLRKRQAGAKKRGCKSKN